MTNPDLESLTSSGRTMAEPPDGRKRLDELTVAELGAAYVHGYALNCPERSSNACQYGQYMGVRELKDYDLGMLVVYPECEACGCMLEVVP